MKDAPKVEVAKLSELARVGIAFDEKKRLAVDCARLLETVGRMPKEISNIKYQKSNISSDNVFAEDRSTNINRISIEPKELLKRAPQTKNGHVEVHQVL